MEPFKTLIKIIYLVWYASSSTDLSTAAKRGLNPAAHDGSDTHCAY